MIHFINISITKVEELFLSTDKRRCQLEGKFKCMAGMLPAKPRNEADQLVHMCVHICVCVRAPLYIYIYIYYSINTDVHMIHFRSKPIIIFSVLS